MSVHATNFNCVTINVDKFSIAVLQPVVSSVTGFPCLGGDFSRLSIFIKYNFSIRSNAFSELLSISSFALFSVVSLSTARSLSPFSCHCITKLLFLLNKLFFFHSFNASRSSLDKLSLTFFFYLFADKFFSTNDKNVSMITMIRMLRMPKSGKISTLYKAHKQKKSRMINYYRL